MTQKYRYLVDLRNADLTEDDKKWVVLDYQKVGEDKSIGALEIRAQLNAKDAESAALRVRVSELEAALSKYGAHLMVHNPYSLNIDPFGDHAPYVTGHITIHQSVNAATGLWGACEISNTGFGSLTAERARLFCAAMRYAVRKAKEWNSAREGKNGNAAPLPQEGEQ